MSLLFSLQHPYVNRAEYETLARAVSILEGLPEGGAGASPLDVQSAVFAAASTSAGDQDREYLAVDVLRRVLDGDPNSDLTLDSVRTGLVRSAEALTGEAVRQTQRNHDAVALLDDALGIDPQIAGRPDRATGSPAVNHLRAAAAARFHIALDRPGNGLRDPIGQRAWARAQDVLDRAVDLVHRVAQDEVGSVSPPDAATKRLDAAFAIPDAAARRTAVARLLALGRDKAVASNEVLAGVVAEMSAVTDAAPGLRVGDAPAAERAAAATSAQAPASSRPALEKVSRDLLAGRTPQDAPDRGRHL